MQYQSFPGTQGGSRSLDKLAALHLPSLRGKRFLDVGCNEGFFCGYALFEGAETIIGIDQSAEAIRKASLRFSEVTFLRQSWDHLPEGNFDVVTLLSALHYAQDQAELVHRLMSKLNDDGLLILEISIAPDGGDQWVKVKRSIDERYFPTRQKLNALLQGYAWKVIGHSVNQAGDPLQRYVVHVRKSRPYVYLMMENPGSGKSSISRSLFKKAGVPVVSGDRTYAEVNRGRLEVSAAFLAVVRADFSTADIDKVTDNVFAEGLAKELVGLWIEESKNQELVIDSYVPEAYRQAVRNEFFEQGYFPVDVTWNIDSSLKVSPAQTSKVRSYLNFLKKRVNTELSTGWKITRTVPSEFKNSLRWHLDSPISGELTEQGGALKLSGWVIKMDEVRTPLQLYVVTDDGELSSFTPHSVREDVLKSLYGSLEEAPAFWRSNPCGFQVEIDRIEKELEIGIIIDGKKLSLIRIQSLESGYGSSARKLLSKLGK